MVARGETESLVFFRSSLSDGPVLTFEGLTMPTAASGPAVALR